MGEEAVEVKGARAADNFLRSPFTGEIYAKRDRERAAGGGKKSS